MSSTAKVHRGLAQLMLAAVVVQFYFAGLAAFGVFDFAAHAVTGWTLILAALLLVVLSAIARGGARNVLLSTIVLLCVILQPVLAIVPRVSFPAVSALHPVNALVIAAILHRLSGTDDLRTAS